MSRELDLAFVGDQLRARRMTLQPEDVGLPRGRRRRTPGLRREEAAALCELSPAYYARLERSRGPRPSPITLARIARGLRFERADRDRLFVAAGHDPARLSAGTTHVGPALMHVIDRLADTPALVLDDAGDVLHQTPSAVALFGDSSDHVTAEFGPYRRIVDRNVGEIVLRRETLSGNGIQLVVYTAAPGWEATLALATVLGHHRFNA